MWKTVTLCYQLVDMLTVVKDHFMDFLYFSRETLVLKIACKPTVSSHCILLNRIRQMLTINSWISCTQGCSPTCRLNSGFQAPEARPDNLGQSEFDGMVHVSRKQLGPCLESSVWTNVWCVLSSAVSWWELVWKCCFDGPWSCVGYSRN
jgi:hypothetical protein